jgi:hypothetical protein
MEITKEQFQKYVRVQESGVTNMFDVIMVKRLTGLTREEIINIMEHYSELKQKHGGN